MRCVNANMHEAEIAKDARMNTDASPPSPSFDEASSDTSNTSIALSEAQRLFGSALLNPDAARLAAQQLAGDVDTNMHRLAIYRGNAIAAGLRALQAHYPVCASLVGASFFEGLAREYRRRCGSSSGDLSDYGAEFARFLADFEPAQSVPYLPDVARLEWAVHEAEHAPDAPPAPVTREPALLWWPGSAVLSFDHAAADIWLAHQPNATVALDEIEPGPQGALVHRAGVEVKVARLPYDQALALIDMLKPSGEPS